MNPLNFKIHDTVFYGAQGVCTVTDKITRDFMGEPKEYFELTPADVHNAKIFVPLDNPKLFAKMQPLLSADECRTLLSSVPPQGSEWINEEIERKKIYTAVLSGTDRAALLGLARCLEHHRRVQSTKGKRLHLTDERFLKNAERLISEEIELVLKLKAGESKALIFCE